MIGPRGSISSSAKSSFDQHRWPHADRPDLSAQGSRASRPSSICTAGRGTGRTASPKSRWIARWRQAACRRRRRHDDRARSAISRLRAGRELVGALAQGECRQMEWRRLEDRRLRLVERRPCRGTPGHAAARSAMARSLSLPRRRSTPPSPGWRCVRPSATPRALPRCRAAQERGHDQEQQSVLLAVGHDPRKQSAGDPRAQGKGRPAPLLIMQGALDDNVLPEMQEKFANTYRAAGGNATIACSRTASTNGSPSPVRRPARRARSPRSSSRASSRGHGRGDSQLGA